MALTSKDVIRMLYEAINAGDFTMIDEVFTTDFIDHSTPDQVMGPEGVRQYFTRLRTTLPDLHISIDDLIAEGEKVVVRTTWHGTETTSTSPGKQRSRSMIQIFSIVNGKIREEWNEGADLL